MNLGAKYWDGAVSEFLYMGDFFGSDGVVGRAHPTLPD